MSLTITMTGRIRHRFEKRFLRRPICILQVEENVKGRVPSQQFCGVEESVEYTQWRDAMPEDLTMQPRNKP